MIKSNPPIVFPVHLKLVFSRKFLGNLNKMIIYKMLLIINFINRLTTPIPIIIDSGCIIRLCSVMRILVINLMSLSLLSMQVISLCIHKMNMENGYLGDFITKLHKCRK